MSGFLYFSIEFVSLCEKEFISLIWLDFFLFWNSLELVPCFDRIPLTFCQLSLTFIFCNIL